jgi:hypothetical protein
MLEELCERESARAREAYCIGLPCFTGHGEWTMRGDGDSSEEDYYMHIYWFSAASLPLESVN